LNVKDMENADGHKTYATPGAASKKELY